MDYPLFKRCSSTDSLFISYATNCFKIFRYILLGFDILLILESLWGLTPLRKMRVISNEEG